MLREHTRPWLIAAVLAAVALTTAGGGAIGGRFELRQQIQQLDGDVVLRRELLRSEIERHRMLPTILAGNPELALAVDPATPDARRSAIVARLNAEFERLAREDGAATLYLVDARGATRVASNFRLPTSFIGQDYSFRSYFQDAIRTGSGELFAQGTVSGVPGLYLAQRLDSAKGVVVTKVEFTDLERNWRTRNDETLVVDRSGTVLLTSNSQRRFKRYDTTRATDGSVISKSVTAGYGEWNVILQRDIGETLLAARLAGALIGGLIGVLLGLGVVLIEANRRRRERQRSELERLVADRTTALETSNRQLLHEIDERIRSESTVQQLREDLAQANRLAILGQISAGVAHEINQPTAAIRTYVDNARKLFERGDHGAALATLSTIASLSERIGFITEELREFSRRSPGRKEPVRLHDVIEGSRLLLEPQLRLRGITLLRPRAPETQRVLANKTRLEQVVVNLIQNAMDALSETRDGTISIDAGGNGHEVWLSIADNGPGVPPERRAQLFAPFSSTKPLGLGLGLVICRDIIADLGGSLEFAPAPDGGAIFTARLPECTT